MKIIVLGNEGKLGRELEDFLSKNFQVFGFNKKKLDITNSVLLKERINEIKPKVIINAAAFTDVEQSELRKNFVMNVNGNSLLQLSEIVKNKNIWLIHFSTDYVFDGFQKSPYSESKEPNPLNIYGKSKLLGEQNIINSGCKFVIFRISFLITKRGKDFLSTALNKIIKKNKMFFVNDQFCVPTSSDLINKVILVALKMIYQGKMKPGIFHLVPDGVTSPYEMALLILKYLKQFKFKNINNKYIMPINSNDFISTVKRPQNCLLLNEKLKHVFKMNLRSWKYDFIKILKKHLIMYY